MLRAALLAERAARQEAEARASGLDAMVAHLKLLIAKLRQERFGASARGAKLDQLELQLEAAASEDRAMAFRSSNSDRLDPCTLVRHGVPSRHICRAIVSSFLALRPARAARGN